jgi:general secretion pathway protein G
MRHSYVRRCVSLLELIVAVLIIIAVAALVVPRFSRAATGSDDGNVHDRLRLLRNAIELYYLDHGKYPGQDADGINAAGTAQAFVSQITQFTDEHGQVSALKDAAHRYGPYLRTGIPPCPLPPHIGSSGVAMVATSPRYLETPTDTGWVYNCQTGDIVVNSNGADVRGLSYDRY